MNRFLSNTPRPVLISVAVIVAVLVLLAVLVPVLGGARDEAFAENAKLQNEIGTAKKAIVQAKDDLAYVQENVTAFEALLKSDRLVPHTRRAAIVRLEEAARANGLTSFSYSIGAVAATSAKAVGNQPTSDAYHVSIENIQIKLGAPFDGSVYRFLVDVADSFPGAAVLDLFSLKRPGVVSADALDAVSSGRDAKLVEGEVVLSWRTAQAKEKTGETKK
jgi:hypothetical protein